MKRINDRLPILMLIICFFYLLPKASQAAELEDSYLSYLGRTNGQDEFRLKSDDLLAKFKGIMPGDQVRQRLVVKNESDKSVDIQLSIVSTDLVDQAFLEQLKLTLFKADKVLYTGTIRQLTGKTGAEFGTFESGQEAEFFLELDVPLTLDNDYNGYVSNSEWTFVATDNGIVPPTKPEPPKPKPNPTPKPAPSPAPQGQNGKVVRSSSLPQMGAVNGKWQLMGLLVLALVLLVVGKKVVKKIE